MWVDAGRAQGELMHLQFADDDRAGLAEGGLAGLVGRDLVSEAAGGLVALALGVEPPEEVRRRGQITRGVGEVEELGV